MFSRRLYDTFIFLGEVKLATRSAIWLDDNLYFELVEPEEISYTYKIRPAKDFGGALVHYLNALA
jgi:hypothetical protein